MRKVKFYGVGKKDNCLFNVVGESFRMDNLRRLAKAGRKHKRKVGGWKKVGVVFWLIPEPKNEYDPNAIAVCGTSKGGMQVGYVPSHKAKQWVGKVQAPIAIKGIVVGKGREWGVKLDTGALKAAGLK